jgi:hypothetical protein
MHHVTYWRRHCGESTTTKKRVVVPVSQDWQLRHFYCSSLGEEPSLNTCIMKTNKGELGKHKKKGCTCNTYPKCVKCLAATSPSPPQFPGPLITSTRPFVPGGYASSTADATLSPASSTNWSKLKPGDCISSMSSC